MKKNTENQEIEKKIIEVIDKIRPFLISDGGNIEFVKYEDGIAYVKMLGHCEIAITSEIPEVIEVRNVE